MKSGSEIEILGSKMWSENTYFYKKCEIDQNHYGGL